jgi:benzoate-CoA ligase family protein
MRNPWVTVEPDQSLDFCTGFNVAVPFIDRHLTEGRADKVAIRSMEGEVTYARLAEQVNRCANLLTDLKMARGDRLCMVIKDCPAFFYVFWGAIKAGIIPVPLNTVLRARDFGFMVENSQCAAIIYSPEYRCEVEAALDRLPRVPRHRLIVEGQPGSLLERLEGQSDRFTAVPASATDACFWLYSSGSTGPAKGAVHLHRDMVVSSEFYGVQTLGLVESDVCFSAAKLFFAYGLGNGMTFPLWVGATTVLLGTRPTPENVFETIRTFRPSVFFGVPTLYASLLQTATDSQPAADLSSVRICVSAGEALPAPLFHRWQERTGLAILDGLGSTELLHIFISNRTRQVRPGSSGTPVPGYQARILDDHGQETKVGEPGRLLVKGLSAARCYWNNPEKTAATMIGDWLDTGDVYYRDGDGYFFYCGRSDDMLKVGGIWCSPFEVESTLNDHPKVLEAAVVGRPDAQGLIKPEAWVVLTEDFKGSYELERDLLQHCKDVLAPYKYPRKVHFVAELPKTTTGKTMRFVLREASVVQPSPGRSP